MTSPTPLPCTRSKRDAARATTASYAAVPFAAAWPNTPAGHRDHGFDRYRNDRFARRGGTPH